MPKEVCTLARKKAAATTKPTSLRSVKEEGGILKILANDEVVRSTKVESWAQYATEKGGGLIIAMKIPIAGLYFCYHTSEADMKGHLSKTAVTACMAMPTTKKEKHIILKKISKEWS